MWIVAHLIGMQGALACAGLCLAWRREGARSGALVLAAAGVLLFDLIAAGMLIPLRTELDGSLRAWILFGAALVWLIWPACLWRVGLARRHPPLHLEPFVARVLIPLGLTLQLALTGLTAAGLVGWFTAHRSPVLPPGWLTLALGVNLAAGALLIGAALCGCTIDGRGGCAGRPPRARLVRAGWLLELAVLARVAAIGGSLGLAAHFSPLGPRFFFVRMAVTGSSLMLTRVLLGLVLPMLFGAMVFLSLGEPAERQAAQQFVPTLILVLLGEILGAGLTLGLSGVAF